MPWFKVDDTLALHPKVLAAGNGAMGLWVRAGSWAMQQLTDGTVPTHVARTLGTAAEARRLVQVGLWLEVDGGYAFHEWAERQPTREQVETDRLAARERQRHARERAKERRESREKSHRDSQGSSPVSHGPPDPTRPDPTVVPTELPASAEAAATAKKRTATRGTRRPDDFRPSQAHIAIAAERGVDLHAEWAKFCDWCDANGKTYKDWPAALRNWIRNARPTIAGQRPQTRVQEHLAIAEQLAAEHDQPRALE